MSMLAQIFNYLKPRYITSYSKIFLFYLTHQLHIAWKMKYGHSKLVNYLLTNYLPIFINKTAKLAINTTVTAAARATIPKL